MKGILTGDTHLKRANLEDTLPALDCIVQHVRATKPDFFIHLGDLFDRRDFLDPTVTRIVRNRITAIVEATKTGVIFLVGNHDAANDWDRVDTIRGAFDGIAGIQIAAKPRIIGIQGEASEVDGGAPEMAVFACLPTPNKYHYAATAEAAEAIRDPGQMRDLVVDVARGLEGQIKTAPPEAARFLLIHGAVDGAVMENEHILTQGLTIPRAVVDAESWDGIFLADIHRPQKIGRGVYVGSTAPLTFAQEGFEPSFIELDIKSGSVANLEGHRRPLVQWQRVPIPVAHPKFTFDVGPEEIEVSGGEVVDVVGHYLDAANEISPLHGADIRVRLKVPENRIAEWRAEEIRENYPGVHRWKFLVERIPATRIRDEDVTFETDIRDLMKRWALANDGPFLDEAQELAFYALVDEIEAEFKASGFERGMVGCRPISTAWTDLFQHARGRIDFDRTGRLNLITGENASGKSNGAIAAVFAKFGKAALPDGFPLRRVVREGARLAIVEDIFADAAGVEWKIVRTVKLSATGKASGDLFLYERCRKCGGDGCDQCTGEGWVPRNEADQRATQAAIHRIVGTPEIYFRTHFARQREVEAPLSLKPAETKDFFQDLLGAETFKVRAAIAVDRRSKKNKELDAVAAKIEALRAHAEDLDELKEKADLLEGEAAKGQASIQAREKELKDVADDLARAREGVQRLAAQAQERLKWIGRRDTLAGKRSGLLGEKRKTEERFTPERGKLIEEALESIADFEHRNEEMDKARDANQAANKKLEAIDREISDAVKEEERIIEKLTAERNRAADQARTLQTVPCQGKAMEALRLEVVGETVGDLRKVFNGCRFLKDAVEASKELAGFDQALANRPEVPSRDLLDRLDEAARELDAVPWDESAHLLIRQRIRSLKADGWMDEAKAYAAAEEKIRGLQRQLEEVEKEIGEHLEAEPEDVSDLLETRREIESNLSLATDQAERRLRADRQAAESVSESLHRIAGKISAIEDARKRAAELEERRGEIARELSAVDMYAKAVGRDGVPFLVLERALPILQERVNNLLEDAPVKIQIDPIRDNETGGIREEVTIHFIDDNGTHPLAAASGYQKDALGIAIRAGSAEMLAEATGSKIFAFWIDEAWGSHTETNHGPAKDQLLKLAKRFERVFYVTHIEAMKDVADTRILVTPGPDGSTLEVVGS